MANLYNLASQDYMALTRAMDVNRNNRLDKQEISINYNAHDKIGNANGVAGTREMATALEKGDVYMTSISQETANNIANYFSKRNENFDRPVAEWVSDAWISKEDFEFSPEVRRAVDANGDNRISRTEFANALASGQLTIGKKAAVSQNPFEKPAQNDPFKQPHDPFKEPARDPFKNQDPFQNRPTQGNNPFNQDGVGLSRAKDFLSSLHSNKMKTNMFGEYVAGTGSLRPNEANTEIKKYLQDRVVNSREISLRDKLDLFQSEAMKANMFGEYDLYSGSLKMDEASSLAKQAVEFEVNYGRGGHPQDIINLIKSKTVTLNMFGEEVPGSGLIKFNDSRSLIKNYLENVVVTSPRLSLDEKLNIIKGQQMAQNMFGDYNTATGTLTVDEASRLAKMALNR